MSQRYPGGFITQNPTAPSNVTARGIWTLDQAVQNIRAGTWPATPVSPPTTIGQAYGGGYYAGQISTTGNNVATHYLIIGPVASAQSNGVQWKTTLTDTPGTSSDIDGPGNSANMNNASHPAGQFCENLTVGGFSDWYLPAKNELEVCYYNLKPTTTLNTTSSGANTNAVPSRSSNYTTGTPAQTSAAAFQSGGAEAFDTQVGPSQTNYWTSTQSGTNYGLSCRFGYGLMFQLTKTNTYLTRARAVRRVAV